MQETPVEFVDMWNYKPDGFAELGGVWSVRIGTNIRPKAVVMDLAPTTVMKNMVIYIYMFKR